MNGRINDQKFLAASVSLKRFAQKSVLAPVVLGSFFIWALSPFPVFAQATLTRAPYIQNVTASTAEVVWKTAAGGDSTVKYGTTTSYGQQATGEAGRSIIGGQPGFLHHVKITDLAVNTKYFYQILTSGQSLSPAADPSYYFKTALPTGSTTPFTFAIFGDRSSGTIASALNTRNPDFYMVAGDVAYNYSADGSVQDAQHFGPFNIINRHTPVYPTCGNHDSSACPTLVDEHALPQGGKAGGLSTFSFDWGNAHFTAINSNASVTYNSSSPQSSAPQMVWAYNDLKNSNQPWKILFWHHNAWSSGSHNTLTNIVNGPAKMAQDLGVDLVFWGHSHVYERFSRYPANGPAFFTIGNGGRTSGTPNCGPYPSGPTCLASSHGEAGFLFGEVNGNDMTLRYVTSGNANPDTSTYKSDGTGGPPPTTNTADLNGDGKVDVIDLGILLSAWGQTTKPKSDINQDGRVDVVDLGILLSKWG